MADQAKGIALAYLRLSDFAVVQHKQGPGWRWTEFEALPVVWFDGLAPIITEAEQEEVWPQGLLDANIAVVPKVDGDATARWPAAFVCSSVVGWCWASADFSPSWRSSVDAWYTTTLYLEGASFGAVDSDVHVFVANVVESLDNC